jgi:hypothetical protein
MERPGQGRSEGVLGKGVRRGRLIVDERDACFVCGVRPTCALCGRCGKHCRGKQKERSSITSLAEYGKEPWIMRPSRNPARAARRKEEVLELQGEDQLRCIYCGNIDPLVVCRRRIEGHHIFGRDRDETEVPACLNCHAVATEHLRDAEVSMTCEQEPTKFARAIFRALAVHFSLLANACWRFARRMR